MINVEEIRLLPLRDKLQMIETLWDDIARREDELEMPQWQRDLLDERERLVESGKAEFLDWEDAKQQISKATQ
ncbi:MAG: putative addiction module component (TIGR02574 family) [Candidatus Binatia bacterium]|jgi:putative addiction module component (TIGR02574 family)